MKKYDANFITALDSKGYEISLSSPYTFQSVSGLTDEHVLDIGDNNGTKNFMTFKHAYAIFKADASVVTTFNPHGTGTFEKEVYNDEIAGVMNLLNQTKNSLNTSFGKDGTFNDKEVVLMDAQIAELQKNTLFSTALEKLIKLWGKLREKGMIQNGDHWKFEKKAFGKTFENFVKEVDLKMTEGVSKGFVINSKLKILGEQIITYTILKKYFSSITISIIK